MPLSVKFLWILTRIPVMQNLFILSFNSWTEREPILKFWMLPMVAMPIPPLLLDIHFMLWLTCNLTFIIIEIFVKHISWSHLLGEYTVRHGHYCDEAVDSYCGSSQHHFPTEQQYYPPPGPPYTIISAGNCKVWCNTG